MSTENKAVRKKGSSFSGRNFKTGMYSSIILVFVVAIVILINLFVSQLDIKVDLTDDNIYTLTDDTASYLKELDADITIYYIVKEGSEYEVLQNVINEYGRYPNIEVQWKDPELYPQFAAQYTDAELTETGNDVIVVNNDTGSSRFIPFDDMYITDYSMDYTTYSQNYSYTLDAEGQITSAIQFVTEESHTKMYVVSAHQETELGSGMKDLIEKSNIQIETLDVLSATEVPKDCNILFINSPASDISETELNMYKTYLENGGAAVLTAGYSASSMPNYNSLLKYYGVEATGSVVLETEGNYLQNYPTYLVSPFESVTDDISSEFSSQDYVIVPIAQGLKLQDKADMRSTITVSNIVVTTEESYAKTNPNEKSEEESLAKTENDISGPFSTVIQAVDTYKDKTSKVAIFASPYMFADDWIGYYSCRNSDLLLDSLDWMRGEDTNSIAVPQRSLDTVYLEVPLKSAQVWAIITIAVVPLAIIAAGFVVWYRRRKH